MGKVFCQCDKCKRDILVGETMHTLSEQKERIEDESTVQPLEANVIRTLCDECAETQK